MTVCIAARAGNVIFGTSDRMLTSGDIQFEPAASSPAQGINKITSLTTSIFMMTAGDAGLQGQIAGALSKEVQERAHREPDNWWVVRDVADLYIKHFNEIRKQRAKDAILTPLYLDENTFITNQGMMNDRLVNDVSKELLNFSLPTVSAIFAGVDTMGGHIFLVHPNDANSLESNCMDAVGFAAIGSGARHASSQFMLAQHAWNAPISETIFLTYYAKRKAEVAPGVGKGTDMVAVGPGLGSLGPILPDPTMNRLEAEYKKVVAAENRGFARAKEAMKHYVEQLQAQAAAAAQQQPPPQSPPDTGGTAPPKNEKK